MLHDGLNASDNRRAEVADALGRLEADDRLRVGANGYGIQSPEQKDYQARRGKEPRPADRDQNPKGLAASGAFRPQRHQGQII